MSNRVDRLVVAAVARAIHDLDAVAWSIPNNEAGDKIREARRTLYSVMHDAGYTFVEPGSKRIKQDKKDKVS